MIKKFTRFVSILNPTPKHFNFRFSSSRGSTKTINYPYQFGGLKNVKFEPKTDFVKLLTDTLGPQTLIGFKEAFKSLTMALAEKDIDFIKNTCEHNLYKNLKFKNVELVNPNAQISFVEGKYFMVIGMKFDRQNGTELLPLHLKGLSEQSGQNKEKPDLSNQVGFISADYHSQIDKLTFSERKKAPFLVGFEMIFKSKMKLVPKGDIQTQQKNKQNIKSQSKQEEQELHSVQFELQITFENISGWRFLKSAFGFFFNRDKFLSGGGFDRLMKQAIGENYEWRIGDIDRVLNRNLKVVAL